MNKEHYPWWGYIKAIVRAYPDRAASSLSGVAKREYEAVQAAVEATERIEGGQNRLMVIRLVYWDRTHTMEGAALMVPCSERTAKYWQRKFFETVARNRGLLD